MRGVITVYCDVIRHIRPVQEISLPNVHIVQPLACCYVVTSASILPRFIDGDSFILIHFIAW